VAAVVVVLAGGSTHYKVHAVFQDAGQLVKGTRVQVGGVTIGSVTGIHLDDSNQAVVDLDITEDGFAPLHDGTVATIRSPSLSTQAARTVSLAPGPNSNAKLDDGATIGAEDTRGIVDLDELFNTLDYQTRSSLQGIVHGFADQFANGQSANANRALAVLNPALSQTYRLTHELTRDSAAFERFIVESAAVVSAIAPRAPDLQHGLTSAAALSTKLAEQDTTIGDLLQRAPGVLRQGRGTLERVNTALEASRPTLRAAQPVAPRLADALRLVAPVAREARPAVRDLNGLLPDAQAALKGLPRLGQIGGQALTDTTGALRGAAPIVSTLRPYVPDVVSGLFNGFGGNVAPYYDANGRYARIGFELPPNFLVQGASGLGSPVAALLNSGFGGGYKTQFPNYCPGASTLPPPDRSAPWVPDEVKGHCDPNQKPAGG
jgi:phospholipid/cholesterol/gamma-HCH transport system substrate-binding protein